MLEKSRFANVIFDWSPLENNLKNEATSSGFHPLIIKTSQPRGVFYSGPSFKIEKKGLLY